MTTAEGIARRRANEELRENVAVLRPVSVGLPLHASDYDVCNQAWELAERCRVRLLMLAEEQKRGGPVDANALRAAGLTEAQAAAIDDYEQRFVLSRICAAQGIDAPDGQYDDAPAVRRMVTAKWWRAQLRKVHARAVESAAINLGVVARDRECYVSNVSVEARRAQNERNEATLEATIAKNLETEQEFTLAQLAAKGVANKSIRRAELMTRINGFERVAISAGHAGLFATITCPSRMHRRKTRSATSTVENGKWDGTLPREAQAYLSSVWARIRAALARREVCIYGFRIAEPNHDGTPHWHCLFFYEQKHDAVVRSTIRRYALASDGDEPGAQEKRVDIKSMDPAKGTAAGYIAKYVAKNIDGYRLEKDLYGNDSFETSARVEAWASRWRIRQFQQIGGPPVTVWRELRRVESVPSDAPRFVHEAHHAVNKTAVYEGRENASVAWDRYVKAQGGVACGRSYRVRLAKAESEGLNCYGEPAAPKPVGIEYFELAKVRDAIGNWIDVLPRTVTVESKRYTWEIKRASRSAGADVQGTFNVPFVSGDAMRDIEGIELPDLWLSGEEYDKWAAKHPDAAQEWVSGLERAERASWTCVNNCTRPAPAPGHMSGLEGAYGPAEAFTGVEGASDAVSDHEWRPEWQT
ncbi:replication endonuclease [Paraburkholderia unamae]|uniref:replication endonuclease n=1 Tax=Paraburkholderia unamae TaxID=219649 RepID=UPI0021ABC4A1|nr:replication endonuclease [Paraburkholderia unamae]